MGLSQKTHISGKDFNFQKKDNIEIHFEITSRCLLSCIHCSSEVSAESFGLPQSISYLSDFLKSVDCRSSLYICISGGEPLMAEKLFPALKLINLIKNKKQVGIFSSGCLFNENKTIRPINRGVLKKLSDNGVTFCYISIYGNSSAIHDTITGTPGSYDCTIKSLHNLIHAGFDTRIHFVPMRLNLNDVAPLIRNLNKIGAREFRVLRLVRQGYAEKNWKRIGLTKLNQLKVIHRLMNLIELEDLNIKITVAGFPEFWQCRPFSIGPKCQAGLRLFHIDSGGKVFPCACMKKANLPPLETSSLFNLKENSYLIKKYNSICIRDE